jgi:hypothetical protein
MSAPGFRRHRRAATVSGGHIGTPLDGDHYGQINCAPHPSHAPARTGPAVAGSTPAVHPVRGPLPVSAPAGRARLPRRGVGRPALTSRTLIDPGRPGARLAPGSAHFVRPRVARAVGGRVVRPSAVRVARVIRLSAARVVRPQRGPVYVVGPAWPASCGPGVALVGAWPASSGPGVACVVPIAVVLLGCGLAAVVSWRSFPESAASPRRRGRSFPEGGAVAGDSGVVGGGVVVVPRRRGVGDRAREAKPPTPAGARGSTVS